MVVSRSTPAGTRNDPQAVGTPEFRRAAEAGRDLTADSFVTAMEGLDYHDPLLDNRVGQSADDHVGAEATILSVVEGGRWKELARLK